MASTKIMGILNATPDSFFADSRPDELDKAIAYGIELWKQGADIIDIGGESTRPNAPPVSEEEEIRRVIPLIQELSKRQPLPISIDTMKPSVAEKALAAGASIINDVSGFRDPAMRELAASSQMQICVMHMLGNPKTMQDSPFYNNGIIAALLHWFETTIEDLTRAGVKKEQIILDPGIGFGKTVAHNLEIIHNLRKLKAIGFPLLLGVSRKTFIRKILGLSSEEVLPATLAMSTIAITAGVDYIRVHDVKEHRQVINILSSYEHTTCGLGQ
ncbi:MAG: dihydropteroate synthase [Parachlamydiaceae bacterium]|nr:dihydropteroate synthase [Parachlamydiaceae bacterium]